MKKKLWSVLLAGVMVFSMIGCGSGETQSTDTAASGEAAAEDTASGEAAAEDTAAGGDSNLIVYTQKTMNQYFHVALRKR